MELQRYLRYLHLSLGIALAIPAILSLPAHAQVIEWARQFGTTGTDEALAVATAPNSVYVAGTATNGAFPGFTNAGNADAFVSKFDTSGNHQWSRQFGTATRDRALGVAADATGVYVVGDTAGVLQGANIGSSDIFVRKYDPNGNELWTRQFGGPNDDQGSAAAVDGTGVYVTGFVTVSLSGQPFAGAVDFFVRKYDFSGNELWTRMLGTSGGDQGFGIAVDASGVYVTGNTGGSIGTPVGQTDCVLRKYDAAGTAAWTRQFGTSATDNCAGAAVNSSGVYVTGQTTGTFAGQSRAGGIWDAFVQKFDLNGNAQWTRQFGTGFEDYGYGVALGGQFVYVAGDANSAAFAWRFDYNGVDSGNIQRGTFSTQAYGVATDSTGAYVVGGVHNNVFEQPPIGDKDDFIFKIPHPPSINGITDGFTFQPGGPRRIGRSTTT
jgi:hypothetical protein